MSNLLARFAENLYWLGRYMERVENAARILHINGTYARDNPTGPHWGHVLDLYADRQRFDATNGESNASNVLAFYILDRTNPTSIVCALTNARENARTVRHLISTEMWTHINLFHSKVQALTQRDLALSNLSRLANDLVLDCHAFEGIVEGTLLRGEAWCFHGLGKYLERADQTTRILDIGYKRLSMSEQDALSSVQWQALLRSVSGYHAFRSRHPAGCSPADVVQFLLYDTEFPRAVILCMKRMNECLFDIEQVHRALRANLIDNDRRSLESVLKTGPGEELTPDGLHAFLDKTQHGLAQVSDSISRTYFQ